MQELKTFFKRKKILLLLCYPAAFFCLLLAKNNTYIAEEVFAKRIYKALSQIISAVTGIFPFSITELLIILLPVIMSVFFVIWIIRLAKSKDKRIFKAADGILNVLITAGILLFMFVLGCGVNYYRYPFSYYAGLTIEGAATDELYDLCISLAERTNEAREKLVQYENEDGVYKLSMTSKELGRKAQKAYVILADEFSILSGYYPAVKSIMFSKFMSKTGITGIFIPFTMEANVNTHIPDYSIASTMCHELAHLHGFIREDEANYISYLACTISGDDELIYSGLMEALIIAGNALYKNDKELYYLLRLTYSEAVKRDLADNSLYWLQFEDSKLNEIAEKVNDTYLKANNQSDGIKSYGRMVDLLIAEYRKGLAE